MKRMILVFSITLIFLAGAGMPTSFAQEEVVIPVQPEEEILGHITDIDLENSIITLKIYTDKEEDAYAIEEIYVLHEATIKKNQTMIKLRDLRIDDTVTVKYRVSLAGRKEVEAIWVKGAI